MKCNVCNNEITSADLARGPFCPYCGNHIDIQYSGTTGGQPQQPYQNQPGMQPQQMNQRPQPGMQPQQMNQRPQPGMQTNQMNQPGFNQPFNQSGNPGMYQQPPVQKKSKLPLILGIVAGVLVLAFITILVITLLKGRGDNEKSSDDATTEYAESDKTDTEEVSTEAVSELTEEITEEATTEEPTTEEPAPVPYAEENGLKMGTMDDTGTGMPAFVFYNSEDALYENIIIPDGLISNTGQNSINVQNITVSEPDSDGMVTYHIEFQRKTESIISDNSSTNWYVSAGAWYPVIFDYYTGYKIKAPDTLNGLVDEAKEKESTSFDLNDKSISIERVIIYDDVSADCLWDPKETDAGYDYTYNLAARYIYVIKAPQDYDGLTIAIYNADINYDEYIEEVKDKDEDEATELRKLLDENKSGYQRKAEDYIYIRVKDYAVEETSESIRNMLASSFDGYDEHSFDWTTNYPSAGRPDDTIITDTGLLDGHWKGFFWWDRDNKLNCYGEEYADVYITSNDKRLDVTIDYNVYRWDASGDFTEKEEENLSVFGDMADDGSVDLSDTALPFTITGFYTDGAVQYAVGTMMMPSGETAEVYFYRP